MSRQGWLTGITACLAVPVAVAHDHAAPGAPADPQSAWAIARARPPLAIGLAFDARGRLWQARADAGRLWVSRSDDAGRTFLPPVAVNRELEPIAADGENRPKLGFGPRGELYVSWTRSLGRPYTGDVRFSRSLDDGQSFAAPLTVNDNTETISHRFDSLIVDGQGKIWLVWLDKRDQSAARRLGFDASGAAVYYAVSMDRGRSFLPNRRLAANSCECCRIALARDTDGTPVAFWRQVFGANVRDHALARLGPGAVVERVTHEQWAVDACPHHGPALAIDPHGAYHLAWFSGAPERAGLFYARSTDAGRSTTAPLRFGAPEAQAGHPALAAGARRVVLAWKEFDGQASVIRVMQSLDGGEHWSEPETLARSAGASDHPLLVSDKQNVYLAWNTAAQDLIWLPVEAPP